jgi:hypothetical protein
MINWFSAANEYQDENLWQFIKIVKSPITLIDSDNQIYSDIYLYEKEWKAYAYTNKWENVFLKWVYLENWNEDYNFIEKDWKFLLQMWLSWVNYNFDENWKQYFELSKKDKINDWIDNYFKTKEKISSDIQKLLYTDEVEKIWNFINQNINNAKTNVLNVLNKIIEYWVNKIHIDWDRTLKISDNYTTLDKKNIRY